MFRLLKLVQKYETWVVIFEIFVFKHSEANFVLKEQYQSCDWETYYGAHLETAVSLLTNLYDHVTTIDNPRWNDQKKQGLLRLSNTFCKTLVVKLTLFSAETVLLLLDRFGFEETNYFIIVTESDEFVAERFNYLFQQLDSYTSFIHLITQTGEYKLDYLPDFGLTITKEPFSNFVNYDRMNFRGRMVSVDDEQMQNCIETPRLPCDVYPRLVLAAARALNFTPTIMSERNYKMFLLNDTAKHPFLRTFIGREGHTILYRRRSSSSIAFIRYVMNYYLLYCEDELKFHTSSYYYWVSPFDELVWSLTLVTILAISVLNCFYYRGFMESVFSLVGSLVRQLSPKRMTIPELIFTLSGFFLMIFYEGSITSELTVPPLPIVAKNLKELIVDRGYKMLYPVYGGVDVIKGRDVHEFQDGFKRYNISEIFWDKIQGYENMFDNEVVTFARRGCNVAMEVDEREKEMLVWKFNLIITSARHCHIAKDPFFERRFSMAIRGRGFQRIVQFMHYAGQVGLLLYWDKAIMHIVKLVHAQMRMMMGESEVEENTQFQITLNEKMFQLFQIYGIGLGISTFVFLVGLVRKSVTKCVDCVTTFSL